MTTGEKIHALRINKGLTQKQLGDKCGMADSAIRRYESGRGNPTMDTLERIAGALDTNLWGLLLYGEGLDDCNEDLIDVLDFVGLSIEATGVGDNYYIWHTNADNPESDRVELEYSKLRTIVAAATEAADIRKFEYLKKRLDADIF